MMSATRPLTKTRKKKPPPAFYEAPNTRTSAQIISEARKSVRSLPTERPYTPADSSRNLFGSGGTISRPPSVYSIGARHFSADRTSRPSTGQKLAPIEKTVVSDSNIKVNARLHEYTMEPFYCGHLGASIFVLNVEATTIEVPLTVCIIICTCFSGIIV